VIQSTWNRGGREGCNIKIKETELPSTLGKWEERKQKASKENVKEEEEEEKRKKEEK